MSDDEVITDAADAAAAAAPRSSRSKRTKTDDSDNDETDEREEEKFTLLIPNEFIGCILGKGGTTIRRLQWQTHTTIKVSSSDEFYSGTNTKDLRMVTIISTSPAAMDAAQSLVLLTIAQSHDLKKVRALVPEEHAGRVIGKGGERIKELRRMCETCDLKSSPDDDDSEDRVLLVEGDVAQLTKTLKNVLEHVIGR